MGERSKRFKWIEGGYVLEEGGKCQRDQWLDLEQAIRQWGEKRYVLMKCVDSKRSTVYSTKRSKPFVKGHKSYVDPKLVDFAYKTFACVHGGRKRKRGGTHAAEESQASSNDQGRISKTLHLGCPFRIHAAYKPHLGKVVITEIFESKPVVGASFALGHNHSVSKDMYDRYPPNLKMSDVEVKRQEHLLSMGVSATQAARLLREETGKPFTAKHIHNERARIKERARAGKTDLEEVKDILSDFQNRYTSLRYEICTRGQTQDLSFHADSLLESTSDAQKSKAPLSVEVINILLPGGMEFGRMYGEVIMLDGTYNTNSLKYPLTLLSIEDAFGCTRIVQMSIVVSENEETIGRALEFYKRHVNGTPPRTVMIDKDCKEEAAIVRAFPEARVLLCRWHVIKYLFQMISEKVGGSTNLKRSIRQATKDMAYARTEEEYNVLYEEMVTMLSEQNNEEPDSFLPYFDRNWHIPCKRSQWTQHGRYECVTFENDTNNRAEAMNGVVKRRTKRGFTLKELILAILEITDEGVFNFKNLAVKSTMYVPVQQNKLYSFFLTHTTNVASNFLCKEAERLSTLHVEPLLDLTSSVGVHTHKEDDIVFEVWKRDEGSNPSALESVSASRRHRVSLSLEDYERIRHALCLIRRSSGDRGDHMNISDEADESDTKKISDGSIADEFDSASVSPEITEEEASTERDSLGKHKKRKSERGKITSSAESAEEDDYMICRAVDVDYNGDAPLQCSCAPFNTYGGLPCRHALAVLEHEFRTCAILLAVPRRWWVRSAVRIAEEIESSLSLNIENKSLGALAENDTITVPSSRRLLSKRAAELSSEKRFQVFKRLCLDLAYICADPKRVSSETAVEIMAEVENLVEKARSQKLIQHKNYTLHVSSEGAPRSAGEHETPSDNESADSNPSLPSHLFDSSPTAEKEGLDKLLAENQQEHSKGQPLLVSQSGKQPGRPKTSERKRRASSNIATLGSSLEYKKKRRKESMKNIEGPVSHMRLDEAYVLFSTNSLSNLQKSVTENPSTAFPFVIPRSVCRIRRFIASGDGCSKELVRKAGVRQDAEICFTIENASEIYKMVMKKALKVPKGKKRGLKDGISVEGVDEDCCGVVLEVIAGPFQDSYFLSMRQLKLMAETTRAVKVWHDSKLLLFWVSQMEEKCTYEPGGSSKLKILSDSLSRTPVDVLHSSAIIKSVLASLPLCSLSAGQKAFEKGGVIYNLETLCCVRGNISRHTPTWLTSDFIQAYLHRLSDTLPLILRGFTFFMPMFEWAHTRHAETFSVDVFMERLRLEKHPILSTAEENLCSSLVYAICNINDSHWISLEVDLAAMVTLIYDPAVGPGNFIPRSHAERLLRVLSAICKKESINRSLEMRMKVAQSPGGQQELASDSYNCGVHSLVWVRFRILHAAKQASEAKKRGAQDMKRSRRGVLAGNKRVRDKTARELDLLRLSMLYDVTRYLDTVKRKEQLAS